MEEMATLRDLMRMYRKSMGWSQEQTAQHWNYSAETISAWERGKRSPSVQEIPRVAHLLGMDTQALARVVHGGQAAADRPKQLAGTTNTPKAYESAFETWGELQHIHRNRTEFNQRFSYPRMFEDARDTEAVGISLNAIALNYSHDRLIHSILHNGAHYRLCFLNPDGEHCRQREIEESLLEGTIADLTRLNIRHMQMVREQVCRVAPELCEHLQLSIYDLPPRYNIFMVDESFMTVQSYGYGRGEDTPTLVLGRQVPGGLFDFYSAAVQYILAHAVALDHTTHSEHADTGPHHAKEMRL